jgi:hypothetical protein
VVQQQKLPQLTCYGNNMQNAAQALVAYLWQQYSKLEKIFEAEVFY